VNVLGKACLITITTNENGKSKVTGVTALPKGTTVPDQVNASVNFSLEPDEFDPTVYQGLSDWFKETIAQSPEYAEIMSGPVRTQDLKDVDFGDDSIPF
jgi:hypothetical protein